MTDSFPPLILHKRQSCLHICVSIDFDAVSGYLGTGHDPRKTLADYSAGIFSAHVGVARLLKLSAKHGISDKVTWFLPGHGIEIFSDEAAAIADNGAEIRLHGYSHEGAYAMTQEQEKDVLDKCVEIVIALRGGTKPGGYRAPLYQIRETTVQLLQERAFLYDDSMNAHDSLSYTLPNPFPTEPARVPDYTQKASTWMVPATIIKEPAPGTADAKNGLIKIPSSWYTEDMTPLGYYPYTPNSQGYVAVEVVVKMWWDRFDWLWENECVVDQGEFGASTP